MIKIAHIWNKFGIWDSSDVLHVSGSGEESAAVRMIMWNVIFKELMRQFYHSCGFMLALRERPKL